MPSPSESAETRDRILQTVDRLFYRQGIRAVSVDMIAGELGISKKTLYRFFPSKNELVLAYLKGRFRPLPTNTGVPPAQQILNNFDWFARSLTSAKDYRGCAFVNAIAEFGEEESEARSLAITYKDSRRLWFRDLLAELDVDDPDTLASQLAILIDGAYSAMLVRREPAMTQAAVSAARILLKNAGIQLGANPSPAAIAESIPG